MVGIQAEFRGHNSDLFLASFQGSAWEPDLYRILLQVELAGNHFRRSRLSAMIPEKMGGHSHCTTAPDALSPHGILVLTLSGV